MAINKETPTWVEGIYQLEESDSPYGGVGGTTNIQFVQLACRTSYLFELLKNLFAASVSGRSCGSWKVDKTIPANTEIKLPIKYIVGARALMLFSDATGEIGPKYYSELGVFDQESDKVRFTFDIPAGVVITAIALATNVGNVVYDGIYDYRFAWEDSYRIVGRAVAMLDGFKARYNARSKYRAEITDDLGISRVVEGEDTYPITDNVTDKTSPVALAAGFIDFKRTNEMFEMTVKSNGKRIREDVAFTDYASQPDDNWNSFTDIFIYDELKTMPGEDLVIDVLRNGVTEHIFELSDTSNITGTDVLKTVTNRNLTFGEEFTGEMDAFKVRMYETADFTDISYGALEKSLVLSITTYGSGESIYLTDIYGGADDNDLVVVASKN